MLFYARIERMQFLEKHLSVVVYRGDTLENFQACAVRGEKGRIFLDRGREPGYQYKETYASRRGVVDAFHFALMSARKLDHMPIVISGRLPRLSKYMLTSIVAGLSGYPIELPQGVNLPVERIWLPRADFNWKELNMGGLPKWLYDDSEVLNHLELVDPSSLMDK